MPTTRSSKWQRKKRAIAHKFEAVEETRRQTAEFWEGLSLPKIKPVNRKPKANKPKGSHKTIKVQLKAIAYSQAEDRDEGECVVCHMRAHEHHHIIKQSTRFAPEYLQRMENVACLCILCHSDIHRPRKGKSEKQTFLEEWQRRYYPEYSAMMKELAKVTGCRDEWLIDRWKEKNLVGV